MNYLQWSWVWDAMANNLIDRCTTWLWEVVIVQWWWIAVTFDACFVYNAIDFIGSDTDFDGFGRLVKNLPAQSAWNVHRFNLLIVQHFDCCIAAEWFFAKRSTIRMVSIVWSTDTVRHFTHWRLWIRSQFTGKRIVRPWSIFVILCINATRPLCSITSHRRRRRQQQQQSRNQNNQALKTKYTANMNTAQIVTTHSPACEWFCGFSNTIWSNLGHKNMIPVSRFSGMLDIACALFWRSPASYTNIPMTCSPRKKLFFFYKYSHSILIYFT